MAAEQSKDELRARLDALAKKIDEHRHLSTAESGAPYAGSNWGDIVQAHGKLSQHIADERSGSSDMSKIHADLESLSLSLDGWIKSVDRRFASKS